MSEFKLFDTTDNTPIEAARSGSKLERSGVYNPLVKQKEAEDRARTVYAHHQRNSMAAGNLRTEILKGIRNAEDPVSLLLKAMECIMLMTGESAYYEQSKTAIERIYTKKR